MSQPTMRRLAILCALAGALISGSALLIPALRVRFVALICVALAFMCVLFDAWSDSK